MARFGHVLKAITIVRPKQEQKDDQKTQRKQYVRTYRRKNEDGQRRRGGFILALPDTLPAAASFYSRHARNQSVPALTLSPEASNSPRE